MILLDKTIGKFKASVYADGWPVVAVIKHGDEALRFTFEELADLEYALVSIRSSVTIRSSVKNVSEEAPQ